MVWFDDYGGTRTLAESVVRQRHHGNLVYRRMAQDRRLDFQRHKRYAAAPDDVLTAAPVDEMSILIDVADIAGDVAAPLGEGLARELVVAEKAEEAAGAVHHHCARMAGRQAVAELINYPDVRAGEREPFGDQHLVHRR